MKNKLGTDIKCNYCGISEEDVWHEKPHVCEDAVEAKNCFHSRLPGIPGTNSPPSFITFTNDFGIPKPTLDEEE